MKIFIPTYGRANAQPTLEALQRARLDATLVVQAREADDYAEWGKTAKLLILPDRIRTISPTRQYLVEYSARRGFDKICMLDDDLIFYKRKAPTANTSLSFSLLDCNEDEVCEIFSLLDIWLDEVPHCGISAREGNNHVVEDHVENTRMMRCLAYRTDTLTAGVKFDRLDIKEDFDVTLQLLRAGHRNRVSFVYAHGQAKGSGAAGGCSTFRDHDMMRRCSEELAAFHPGLVRVVEKETKGSFGGGIRTEVVCYWQKAYKESLKDKIDGTI